MESSDVGSAASAAVITMFKRRDKNPARFDTLIGKSARVQGDLQFRGGLHIDGSIGGNVFAAPDTAATLSVSEYGQIDGSVDAPQVVLNGRVNGDIVATERLVLGAKARVQGNVHYGAIELALGAKVNGRLVPRNGNAAVTAEPAAKSQPGLTAV